MMSIKSLLSAFALAIATLLPMGELQAAPFPPANMAIERNPDMIDAAWRRACHDRNCHHVWHRPPVVIHPRLIVRPPVIIVPGAVVTGGWNAHVRWCYAHHRHYNHRTNRYVGRDGHRHVCVSPYRY